MSPIVITVIFFAILGFLIGNAATSTKRSTRIAAAIGAFAWSFLMFLVASWATKLNYNIWYSSSALRMLKSFSTAIDEEREESVQTEIKKMIDELQVTYENRGNFKELADEAAKALNSNNTKSQ